MSQSLVLEAQDGTCGYLNSVRLASYGCQAITQKCAVYYPTSSLAADITGITDIGAGLKSPATQSFKTLTQRAAGINAATITPAPQVDSPAAVCCDPSIGDCTAQPTACVDAFEHPYSALCTGNCVNDPMTLKCTAGHALHCNQIQFQSPLYYQRNADYNWAVNTLEARMGVAKGAVRGWFCGKSALPTRIVESTIISRRPVYEDKSSRPVADEVITSSAGDLISQSVIVPSAITLPEQLGAVPGPEPSPRPGSNPGTIDSGDVPSGDCNYELDAAAGEDYCVDDSAPGEDCCTDDAVRRARQLRRRRDPEIHRVGITFTTSTVTSPNQIGLATTTATPAAAPAMVITEGFAVASTAYVNQSGRSSFSEATRTWNIVVPTPISNVVTTSKNSTGPREPKWPKKNPKEHHGPAHIGRIVGGAGGGFLALVLLLIIVNRCNKKRKLGAKQSPGNEEEGREGVSREGGNSGSRAVSRSDWAKNYLWDKYAGVKDSLSLAEAQPGKLTPPTIPPRPLRSDSDPGRSTAFPRDRDHPQSGGPQTQQALSPSGNNPVYGMDETNGPSPESIGYYHAISKFSDAAAG